MSEIVSIDKETAEKEFDRLCKSWHIKLNDEEGEGGGKTLKKAIVKALVAKELEIRDGKEEGYKLVVHQHLCEPVNEKKTIIHKYVSVKGLITLDGIDEKDNFKRMVACVSATTREAEAHIREMHSTDLYTGATVTTLFLVQ